MKKRYGLAALAVFGLLFGAFFMTGAATEETSGLSCDQPEEQPSATIYDWGQTAPGKAQAYGQVRNDGKVGGKIYIRCMFYGKNGEAVGVGDTTINYLAPGQSSSWTITRSDDITEYVNQVKLDEVNAFVVE